MHKTIYSLCIQLLSRISSENLYLTPIDRLIYAVTYPILGIVTFRFVLIKFFPEKRFTLRSPDKSIIKMLLFSAITVSALILFMLAYDRISKNLHSDGMEKHVSRDFFLVLFVISSVIVTPILEEFFYRELLGKYLMERMGIQTGLLFQGLFFALMHDISSAPVIFSVGVAAGMMYIKFGLKGSVITHGMYNAAIIASVFFNIRIGSTS